MRGPAPIAAIVVHFYGGDALTRCLASLARGSRAPDRIAVVDNGSASGWREALKAAHPGVRVIVPDRNRGFAGALPGELAELAEGGALLILNQDVELERECLDRLAAALERSGAAIACPTVLGPDGRIGSQGGDLDLWTGRVKDRARGAPPGPATTPFEVGYAPGAAMLVRASDWRAAGGMDPEYFMYFEDADLAARLRRLGRSVICVPEATCRHSRSSSAGPEDGAFQSYFRLRNRARFVRRNGTALARAGFTALVLPCLLARDALRYAARGRLAAYREVWRGLADLERAPRPPAPEHGR